MNQCETLSEGEGWAWRESVGTLPCFRTEKMQVDTRNLTSRGEGNLFGTAQHTHTTLRMDSCRSAVSSYLLGKTRMGREARMNVDSQGTIPPGHQPGHQPGHHGVATSPQPTRSGLLFHGTARRGAAQRRNDREPQCHDGNATRARRGSDVKTLIVPHIWTRKHGRHCGLSTLGYGWAGCVEHCAGSALAGRAGDRLARPEGTQPDPMAQPQPRP